MNARTRGLIRTFLPTARAPWGCRRSPPGRSSPLAARIASARLPDADLNVGAAHVQGEGRSAFLLLSNMVWMTPRCVRKLQLFCSGQRWARGISGVCGPGHRETRSCITLAGSGRIERLAEGGVASRDRDHRARPRAVCIRPASPLSGAARSDRRREPLLRPRHDTFPAAGATSQQRLCLLQGQHLQVAFGVTLAQRLNARWKRKAHETAGQLSVQVGWRATWLATNVRHRRCGRINIERLYR